MHAATTTAAENQRRTGNTNDRDYNALRSRLSNRFTANTKGGEERLFTTDATGLWEAYLESFPARDRQYHTCSACRHFVERFGGLVTIDEDGRTRSAVWDIRDADDEHRAFFDTATRIVAKAKVTGIFLSTDPTLGDPVTGDWTHFAVSLASSAVYRGTVLTDRQTMAERREDYKNVARALDEFTAESLEQVVTLLRSDALYRSEKVLGQAEWLAGAKGERKQPNSANRLWRRIALAPAGFCHPRSSMIGTLLDDIAAGLPFADVARKFRDKMHPLQYQRPQAPPSAGNIAAGEKLIEALGAERSLLRRFARLEEIETIWRPVEAEPPKAGGVFSHLTPKDAVPPSVLHVPAQLVTWEKFCKLALGDAKTIELLVPVHGPFIAITTAEHPDAPPILQWDREGKRNPFAWYVYSNGSPATRWGLTGGTWRKVTAVTMLPPMWRGGEFAHQGEGAIFVLEGAQDLTHEGAALFPETLRSELREIRATIEAYSKAGNLGGKPEASACGYDLRKRGPGGPEAHVRVTAANGSRLEYRIDRWD